LNHRTFDGFSGLQPCLSARLAGGTARGFPGSSHPQAKPKGPINSALGSSPAAPRRVETSVASIPDRLLTHIVEDPKSHLVRDIGKPELFIGIRHAKRTASAWTTECGLPGAKLHRPTGT